MLSINWTTRVISVPQSYLTNIGGDVYELDINTFRESLKDLEDDVIGMVFLTTHNNVTPINLSGVTLARVVELINGYTVTFEDTGTPYAVNLLGANSNIADNTNINNVSVRSFNSAGLVQITSGSGLSVDQSTMLEELYKIAGLDILNPLTVTPALKSAGSIDLELTGDGETITIVTRQ